MLLFAFWHCVLSVRITCKRSTCFRVARMRRLFLEGQILDGEGTMTHLVVREAMQCGPIFYQARLCFFECCSFGFVMVVFALR